MLFRSANQRHLPRALLPLPRRPRDPPLIRSYRRKARLALPGVGLIWDWSSPRMRGMTGTRLIRECLMRPVAAKGFRFACSLRAGWVLSYLVMDGSQWYLAAGSYWSGLSLEIPLTWIVSAESQVRLCRDQAVATGLSERQARRIGRHEPRQAVSFQCFSVSHFYPARV